MLCLWFTTAAFAPPLSMDDVLDAIKKGDAMRVSKFFDNTVQINLPDKNASYSKSQAFLIIRDFFANNKIKGLNILYKSSNLNSHYCFGSLLTVNGSFKMSLFMRQDGSNDVIQELHFEK